MRNRPALLFAFSCLLASACSRAPAELQPCVACAGTGLITDEVLRQQQGQRADLPAKPDAVHPCDACQGSGKVPR